MIPTELHDLLVIKADLLFPDELNYDATQRAALVVFAEDDIYVLVPEATPFIELGDAVENAILASAYADAFGDFLQRLQEFCEYTIDITQEYYGEAPEAAPQYLANSINQASTGAPTLNTVQGFDGNVPVVTRTALGRYQWAFPSNITDDTTKIFVRINNGDATKPAVVAAVVSTKIISVATYAVTSDVGGGALVYADSDDILTKASLSIYAVQ